MKQFLLGKTSFWFGTQWFNFHSLLVWHSVVQLSLSPVVLCILGRKFTMRNIYLKSCNKTIPHTTYFRSQSRSQCHLRVQVFIYLTSFPGPAISQNQLRQTKVWEEFWFVSTHAVVDSGRNSHGVNKSNGLENSMFSTISIPKVPKYNFCRR